MNPKIEANYYYVFAKKQASIKVTVSGWKSDTKVVNYYVFKPLKHSDKILGQVSVEFEDFVSHTTKKLHIESTLQGRLVEEW